MSSPRSHPSTNLSAGDQIPERSHLGTTDIHTVQPMYSGQGSVFAEIFFQVAEDNFSPATLLARLKDHVSGQGRVIDFGSAQTVDVAVTLSKKREHILAAISAQRISFGFNHLSIKAARDKCIGEARPEEARLEPTDFVIPEFDKSRTRRR
jgi:hypothetical protein